MRRTSAAARVGLAVAALALMAVSATIQTPVTVWSAPSDAPAAGNAIPNNDAASPTDLLHLPFTTITDTSAATLEIGETQPCGDIGATLWYLYRPSFPRHVIIDTEGSGFDTVLAVYSRTFSPPGGLDEIACNDNAQGGTTSGLALDVTPGLDYLIQVGGASGATGSLTLNVAANPPGGTVTGTITDNNAAPLSGALVLADSVVCCNSAFVLTQADGTYALIDMLPGSYTIRANATGFVSEFYDGAFTFAAADDVFVTPGGTQSNIDIQLGTGGGIAGAVVDGNGVPLANVVVSASSFDCCSGSATVTGADGTYTINQLGPGSYVVHADLPGYAPEYYDNVYDFDLATLVPVTNEDTTPSIDFALNQGGSISGFITDENGDPLVGASVYGGRNGSCCGDGYGNTGIDGSYTLTGLAPGDYRVFVEAFGYPPKYYIDAFDPYAATEVSIADGQSVTDINVQMTPGGSIAGTIMDSDGVPIEGAFVAAQSQFCCISFGATTEPDGTYVIEGIAAGSYYVRAAAPGFSTELWDNVFSYDAASIVNVTSANESSGIDFTLEPGGSISGLVTNDIGEGISGASVFVEPVPCCGTGYGYTSTDFNGFYTVSDLAPGDYVVRADATGFAGEYFDDTYDFGAATHVPVQLGTETPDINLELAEQARISGRVTDADGHPISNAYVAANSEVCCTSGGYAYTDANGDYTIAGLAPGSYRVYSEAFGFVGEYYDDVHDYYLATFVTVGAGEEATGIDFALDQAGAISGVVTNANGDPVAGAYVFTEQDTCCGYGDTYTDGNGAYTVVNLPPGAYYVRTTASGYAGEYFDNVYDSNAATLVAVTSGDTTPDIDFSLDIGGSISGVVRNDNGDPISGAEVDASSVGCCAFGYAYADASGSYTILDLPPGDYVVQAFASGYNYEFFDNVTNYGDATPVHVDLGSDTPGIDFALAPPDPDSAADAKNVDPLPFTDARNTSGAGLEEGEPQPCGDVAATIWYRFLAPTSPPFNGGLKVDTMGSDFDTVFAVYTHLNFASSPPGGSTLLDCTDDGDGGLEFPVEAGNLYYLQIGGNDGATGNLVVHVTCPGDANCDGEPDEGGSTATATPTSPDATATPTEAAGEDTTTPTPTDVAETPIAGPGTGTVEATSTSDVTTTPEVTRTAASTPDVTPTAESTPDVTPTAESTPDVTPTSPAGESVTPESTPESTPDPTVTEPATEEPTLTATLTTTPTPTSTSAPPTATKTHAPRTHTPSPTRTSQSTPQPSVTASTSVATPPQSSTAGPVSDVLGTEQRPITLPNTGDGGRRSSSDAVMLIGLAAAALLGGTMLMSARQRWGSNRR